MKKLLDKLKSWLHRIGLLKAFPKPTKKAKRWAEKNTWFKEPQTDLEKSMFACAFFLHSQALNEGLSTDSDEYFDYIDAGMRENFASYGWEKVDE